MAPVKGNSSNGYRTVITEQDRDITHSLLWFANDTSKKQDAALPVWAQDFDGLGAALNIVLDAFSRMKVEHILDLQISVQIAPENPKKGKNGHMVFLDGTPFLTFENTQGLLIPLGQGEHFNKLSRASFLEKLFASKTINMIENGGRDIKLSNNYSIDTESVIAMYERYGMTKLEFGQDLENSVRQGTIKNIERTLLSTGNTYFSLNRVGLDSWLA